MTRSVMNLESKIKKELELLANKYIDSGSLKKNQSMIFNYVSKYLLFSPTLNASLYAIDYRLLGLKQPYDYKKFINTIKEELNIDKRSYYYLKNEKITEDIYTSFNNHMNFKKIFFTFRNSASSNSQLDSLFRSIRNGFAHGNFVMADRTFVIWNNYKGSINALIVISTKKLERLIKLFTPDNHKVL